MTGWLQLEEYLFCEALSRKDAATRREFLDEVCAGNLSLRRRIDRLLVAHAEAGCLFAGPADARRQPAAGAAGLSPAADRKKSNL